MDHPFWKKSFRLETEKDLTTLRNSAIAEVWIDTELGRDVDTGVAITTEETATFVVSSELARAQATSPAQAKTSLSEELFHARQLIAQSKVAITSMFQEIRMGNVINVAEAGGLVDEITRSIERNPEAFLNLARLKNVDDYTYLHSVAVCGLMIALGKQLGLTGQDLKNSGIAGLLHDAGKALIPNEILNKPSKLTDDEFAVIKNHPRLGWEVLNLAEGIDPIALDVCLHHHERVDGKGYPNQISGDQLTLFARMGAVCDVYDAITSHRCYKPGWEPAESIRKMAEWRDGHFDEKVFRAFVKTIGIYPSGSLVRLKSGRLAIVLEQSGKSLLTPLVKVFFSIKSNAPIMPEILDLSRSQETIIGSEDPSQWGFDLKRILGS